MEVFKVSFRTSSYDPEYSSFEKLMVANQPKDIFMMDDIQEIFEDEDMNEKYDREISVSTIGQVQGTDGKWYKLTVE